MLVDDFVKAINKEREDLFYPSGFICVDESISCWDGIGGEWINDGLPTYVAIDRKPENGCEIQNACDGQSGIMMRLKIVKSAAAEAAAQPFLPNEDLNHGTHVLAYLVMPWACTAQTVVGDSYFALVQAARYLYKLGLRFIGVVKTATVGFPMAHLQSIQFNSRGDWSSLFHCGNGTPEDPDLLSFAWVDRDRRYFISSASNVRQAEDSIERRRLRQVDQASDALPEYVDLSINQPNCSSLYYDNCSMIDRHNRIRQDELRIERKLGTKHWHVRVNMTLFSMCVVDAYLLHRSCTGCKDTPSAFFWKLAEELIDQRPSRHAAAAAAADAMPAGSKRPLDDPSPPSGVGIHVTPTKVMKQYTWKVGTQAGGKSLKTGARKDQQRCKECDKTTTDTCSHCLDKGGPFYIHHPDKKPGCWAAHLKKCHSGHG
jgi:hypothetical protein